MALTSPPEIPLITDPFTFATRAQDWVVWQADSLYPFLEDGASLLGQSTSTTSTTSNTIGTGSKSFTVELDKGFIAGMSLSIARTAAPTNRMFAVVTSYNSGTGALVVNSQAFEGSGTYTDWSIAQAFPAFLGGTLTNDTFISGASLRLSKGADVASASTLPLITDGNYFDVTGTTTITSFASMGIGTQIVLHFDGALTLTHNATDLILPSGANITTAAGDEAGFIEYASGDWRCVWYTKADGLPLISFSVGSPVATTSGTSINVASSIPATAKKVTLSLNNVSINATDNIVFRLNGVSSGYGGASQQSTAAAVATVAEATAFRVTTNSPIGATAVSGHATFMLHDATNFIYTYSIMVGNSNAATMYYAAGTVTLSGLLTTIAITSLAASTFDGGSVTPFIE